MWRSCSCFTVVNATAASRRRYCRSKSFLNFYMCIVYVLLGSFNLLVLSHFRSGGERRCVLLSSAFKQTCATKAGSVRWSGRPGFDASCEPETKTNKLRVIRNKDIFMIRIKNKKFVGEPEPQGIWYVIVFKTSNHVVAIIPTSRRLVRCGKCLGQQPIS